MKFEKITEEEAWEMLFKKIQDPLTEKIVFDTTKPIIEISDSERKRMEFERKIRHEINECINEELSISDDVKNASNRIIYEIELFIKKLKTESTDIQGVSQKKGQFSIKVFNKDLKINIFYYNFFDRDSYNRNYNYIKKINNSAIDTINITILAISGTIDPRTLNDTIYHEMEHIFQKSIIQKYFGGKDLYNHAINDKKSSNPYSRALGEIVYLTRKFEQDAYINGLYGLLMGDDNDITYIVTHSDVYKKLLDLQRSYYFILNANKEDINFKIAISGYQQFNYSYNRFIKEATKAIKYINNKIGKIIIKSKNDKNKQMTEIVSYHKPFYVKDDRTYYQSMYHIDEFPIYK